MTLLRLGDEGEGLVAEVGADVNLGAAARHTQHLEIRTQHWLATYNV